EFLDRGRAVRAFDPAIPAHVVVAAVAVLLAVRLVVFPVVRDQIVHREAVVAGDEVDAVFGLAFLSAVDVGAAEQPGREMPYESVVASQEMPDVVAETAVPFLPRVADEGADLIESGGVPGFGDELRAGQQRVRLDV